MKLKTVIYFFILFLPLTLTSQKKSGVAIYSVTTKIEVKKDPKLESLGIELPDKLESKSQLTFNDSISSFKNIIENDPGDSDIKFYINKPQHIHYIDRKNNIQIEQKDIFGKYFIVESPYKPLKWELKPEVKKIGDYFCQMAILKDTSKNVTAWYTPQVPVNCGPEGYGDLPGLIVVLISNDGKHIVSLENLELKDIKEIPKPSKGKKVTEEEFNKLFKEKMASFKNTVIFDNSDDDD